MRGFIAEDDDDLQLRLYADADEATILADGTVDMRFYTSGAEKMRIDTSGNVGIGTTSPVGKLYVGPTWSTNYGSNDLYINLDIIDFDFLYDSYKGGIYFWSRIASHQTRNKNYSYLETLILDEFIMFILPSTIFLQLAQQVI